MISISDSDWLARRDALRNNAIAAMMAAIEVYNKPKIEYRNECFVILMINSWELLFKAILSMNQISIFQPNKGDMPRFSLSLLEAMKQSKSFIPNTIPFDPVVSNIKCLNEFRNNVVHFYNEEGFDVLFYGLAQTSITNFRDLVIEIFQQDVADEINLSLLPISFGTPPDPIHFLRAEREQRSQVVSEYIKLISDTTGELESKGTDTGRFLTLFSVNLQSAKKIESADLVAAVTNEESKDATFLPRTVDPNRSHPLRQKEVLEQIGPTLHDLRFTSYTFQAVVWNERIKENHRFYWKLDKEGLGRYSQEIVAFLKNTMTKSRIEECLLKYGEERRRIRQKNSESG